MQGGGQPPLLFERRMRSGGHLANVACFLCKAAAEGEPSGSPARGDSRRGGQGLLEAQHHSRRWGGWKRVGKWGADAPSWEEETR